MKEIKVEISTNILKQVDALADALDTDRQEIISASLGLYLSFHKLDPVRQTVVMEQFEGLFKNEPKE